MSERTGSIVSELDEKLDSIFGKDETENFSFKESGPSPLVELKGLMLTIDWEISDDTISEFNHELESLKRLYVGDSIVPPLLKMLSSLTAYLKSKKASSHNDTLTVINSVYRALEAVVEDDNLTAQDKKILVDKEIGDFKKFKASLAPVKPLPHPAVKEVPTPVAAEKEEYDFLAEPAVEMEDDADKEPMWDVRQEEGQAPHGLSADDAEPSIIEFGGTASPAPAIDLTSVVDELRQTIKKELATFLDSFERQRRELEILRSEFASLKSDLADIRALRTDIKALSTLGTEIAEIALLGKDLNEIKNALAGMRAPAVSSEPVNRETETAPDDYAAPEESDLVFDPLEEVSSDAEEPFAAEPVTDETEQKILDLDDLDSLDELKELSEEKPDSAESSLSDKTEGPDLSDTLPDFSLENGNLDESAPLADEYFYFELGGRKYAIDRRNVLKASKGNGRLLKKARKKGALSMLDVKPPFGSIKNGIEEDWKGLSARDLKTSLFPFIQNDSVEGLPDTRGGGILFLGLDEKRGVLITDNLPRKEVSGTETELRVFPKNTYVCGELVKGDNDGECYRILDAGRLLVG